MTDTLLGNAALMRLAMSGSELAPDPATLGQQLLARAESDPHDANALMDLSTLLQLTGQRELALALQQQALAISPLYHLPARDRSQTQNQSSDHNTPALRLLGLYTAGDLMSNTPLDCLLETANVSLDMLYLSEDGADRALLDAPADTLSNALPEHDLLFIAIAPAARHEALLARLDTLTRNWPRPVLNLPAQITWTLRDQADQHLRDIPGLLTPLTRYVSRSTLSQISSGQQHLHKTLTQARFPIIVRPIDTHAGQGMVKIEQAAELVAFLQQASNDSVQAFHLSNFIDYRSADGLYRKYRIVLIDGQPYACHMGISTHWMIHYLNADMDSANAASKRAEEARFMHDFDQPGGFAQRHAAALVALHKRIPLDYLVIDCAEVDGELLVFEVDPSAVVHAMDPVAVFPYKQPQMQKVFRAFCAMLAARCRERS